MNKEKPESEPHIHSKGIICKHNINIIMSGILLGRFRREGVIVEKYALEGLGGDSLSPLPPFGPM